MNIIFIKGMILILTGAILFGATAACGGAKGGSRKASGRLKPMTESTVLGSDENNTIALKADGAVVACGQLCYEALREDVSEWTNMRLP